MKRRPSYQHGSVVRRKRKSGPDAWVFRYYEYDLDGNRQRAAEIFSDSNECPTQAKAEKKAEALRQRINESRSCVTFDQLADKYEKEDLPANPHTRKTYKSNLKHLRDRWGGVRIDEMAGNVMAVRAWLNSQKSSDPDTPEPLAQTYSKQTRQHLRNLLHRIFEDAMAWNLLPLQRNPMDLLEVTGGQRPRTRKVVLSPQEISRLVNHETMPPHVRMIVLVLVTTGMRISEVLGLRWEDMNFPGKTIWIRRRADGKDIRQTKTEESEQENYPMHPLLAEALEAWKKEQASVKGWVFGCELTERPFHASTLLADHLKAVARAAGVSGLLERDQGWHTFRHTYRRTLADLGEPLEVQQALMRHSSPEMTMRYGKFSAKRTESLRRANARVVELVAATRPPKGGRGSKV